jgi:23S rRNA (pseudouridine1915-N3)-methyltransferase
VRLLLLSVGRPRDPAAAALHDLYAARIRAFGVDYEARWVKETRGERRYSDDHVREREAEALLGKRTGGTWIAMDPGGTLMSSEKLAASIERWAAPSAAFVVGGPLGLHRSVLDASDRVWSLSPLTFPHEIARALVAEQLYRAITILRGVPYHK